AVELFFGAKIALGALLSGVLPAASALRPDPVPHLALLTLALGALGFYAPNFWLDARVRGRQTELSKSLPDTLDLLVTCVEAGLGMEAALGRVTGEIRLSAPRLSLEL